jgi:DNA-binding NtrC family response regulator
VNWNEKSEKGSEMTILVIEDDIDLLAITSKRIEKMGFFPLRAQNLTEARVHLEANLQSLVAVVSDLFIGEENGVSFFEEIRARILNIPYVITTGDEDGDPRVRKYSQLGNNFYCLQKPFSLDTLRLTLQSAKVKTA